MQFDTYWILLSFLTGVFSTLVMTIFEIPFWKKWNLTGVLEWHENQALIIRILKLPDNIIHFWGIFLLHFINGGLGGIGFLMVLIFIPSLHLIPILILALLYGFFLWIITLIPIHKPITGLNPWRHPLGHGPAIVSLLGHLIYCSVLSILFSITFVKF
ncbi:MAG: hypothetical protein ACE5SW_09850 [Nitrososphaeraceae archaeon]